MSETTDLRHPPPDPRPGMSKSNGYFRHKHQGDIDDGVLDFMEDVLDIDVEAKFHAYPTSWRIDEQTRLQGLLDYVSSGRRVDGVDPWQGALELYVQCQGGEVARDRRCYTVTGAPGYSAFVGRSRSATYGAAEIRVAKSAAVAVMKSPDSSDLDASWGRDSMHVKGDARLEFQSRTFLMSGHIARNWNGGVVKMCSMEGVIAGGAMVRVIAGPAASMSPLCTGDVYGGILRSATARANIAIFHYRAAKDVAWVMGVYVRAATFVIEPLIGATPVLPAYGKVAAKLAKIGQKVTRIAMICPPVDILFGIFVGIPVAIFGIGVMIAALIRTPNVIPPLGPPKTHVRHAGVINDTQSSIVYL